MNISQDEKERAVLRSRKKFEMDIASNMATAEDRGAKRKALTIANNMLRRNRPIEEIVEDTDLTHDEVESLRKQVWQGA